MKRNGYRLFIDMFWLLLCSSLTNAGSVNNHEQLVPEHPLMTSRDIITHSLPSNITIQNKTGDAITVYGLYINQFADNSPPPNDCTSPTLLYSGFPPKAAGAFVSRVALGNNQKIELGANYLYNMIYTAIFFRKNKKGCYGNKNYYCGYYIFFPVFQYETINYIQLFR